MNREEKDKRDYKIMEQCGNCCLACDKYETVKDMNKFCEPRKARARVINRGLYYAKKAHNQMKVETSLV